MISLASEARNKEEKVAALRKQGFIPGVLYGPKTKNQTVKVEDKQFQKAYNEAGESSLVNLKSQQGASPVLIRDIQKDPVKGTVIHVDFYQPPLDEEIQVYVPLVFEGEAPAVKDLGGTLLKSIQEVEVRALPQDLPHEIVVDVSKLATFDDHILVQDLVHEAKVHILREPDEVVAQAVEAEDVEAELEQPVEENVESVESAKPEKKEEEGEEGEASEEKSE